MSLDDFLLSKDTKVFLLHESTTAERMVDSHRISQTTTSFKNYGFSVDLKPYPSTSQIINDPYSQIGVKPMPFDENVLNTLQLKQWYGFLSVVKKARGLRDPYIITFPRNILVKDLNLLPYNSRGVFRFPSSNNLYKNYIIHPEVGIELYKEVKNYSHKYGGIIDVDLHQFMEVTPYCDTLDENFRYANK